MEQILKILRENVDEKYGDFHRRLIPTVEPSKILGVRTPVLRKLAKTMYREGTGDEFLQELPHTYYEENQLHGFIISEIKDFDRCVDELDKFLPFIDNWATCDQTSPKIFKKHRSELVKHIDRWLKSEHTYTIRFAIGMLMEHFLGEDFREEYMDRVVSIESEEYYVNMEIAWYMATALAKQWDSGIKRIESRQMGRWVHNKTIQKAVESYRITQEKKAYLRKLKII